MITATNERPVTYFALLQEQLVEYFHDRPADAVCFNVAQGDADPREWGPTGIVAALELLGFEETCTGGNCTALALTRADGQQMLVTVLGESYAPEHGDDIEAGPLTGEAGDDYVDQYTSEAYADLLADMIAWAGVGVPS